jgi:hypothetical protein
MILLTPLCGCNTWFVPVREDYELRIFENKVIRKTFGSKRKNETSGQCRILHKEELDLHTSPKILTLVKTRMLQ